jgi:exopolysaccharide biosynthesis polyprenyl glycosylphosphotransferase
VSTVDRAELHPAPAVRIVEADRTSATRSRRGRMLRRALALGDVVGLTLAFLIAAVAFAEDKPSDLVPTRIEVLFFVCTLPLWLLLAKLLGLYERDDERTDHSTADEITGVVQLVTLGTWLLFIGTWATGLADPQLGRLVSTWLLALLLVPAGRVVARSLCRRSAAYVQRTLVVGAGVIGQLVARKVQQHPEYGLDLVGFVDEDPREQRADIGEVPVLGGLRDLSDIVDARAINRVIVAFSGEADARTMALVRSLRDRDVIVDVVPRLFDVVGPRASLHSIEGLALVSLPPARISRTARVAKRALDLVGAALFLVLTAPLFAYLALRIKLDSRGPVFFRQSRLGVDMQPFTAFKFRTMRVGTDTGVHRDYIRQTMSSAAVLNGNNVYKLDRDDAITPFGRWLRKTSLDELPQLINVLRGEMSLVGPRPCIPYETENFEPHHFERFLVPQGLTGLWQVTARASSTFGEALDMDVVYVRGWSLGLDVRLLLRTPFALLRQRKSTA